MVYQNAKLDFMYTFTSASVSLIAPLNACTLLFVKNNFFDFASGITVYPTVITKNMYNVGNPQMQKFSKLVE